MSPESVTPTSNPRSVETWIVVSVSVESCWPLGSARTYASEDPWQPPGSAGRRLRARVPDRRHRARGRQSCSVGRSSSRGPGRPRCPRPRARPSRAPGKSSQTTSLAVQPQPLVCEQLADPAVASGVGRSLEDVEEPADRSREGSARRSAPRFGRDRSRRVEVLSAVCTSLLCLLDQAVSLLSSSSCFSPTVVSGVGELLAELRRILRDRPMSPM